MRPGCPLPADRANPTTLACELICAMIARALGLRVPNYACIELPKQLVEQRTRDDRDRLRPNVGLNFGSQFLDRAPTFAHEEIGDEQIPSFENLLSFDASVLNGDRRDNNPNLIWFGNEFLLIDHGFSLHDSVINDHLTLFPRLSIDCHVSARYLRGAMSLFTFSCFFTRWEGSICQATLEEVRAHVPRVWENACGELDRIFNFLSLRCEAFDGQAQLMRETLQ